MDCLDDPGASDVSLAPAGLFSSSFSTSVANIGCTAAGIVVSAGEGFGSRTGCEEGLGVLCAENGFGSEGFMSTPVALAALLFAKGSTGGMR